MVLPFSNDLRSFGAFSHLATLPRPVRCRRAGNPSTMLSAGSSSPLPSSGQKRTGSNGSPVLSSGPGITGREPVTCHFPANSAVSAAVSMGEIIEIVEQTAPGIFRILFTTTGEKRMVELDQDKVILFSAPGHGPVTPAPVHSSGRGLREHVSVLSTLHAPSFAGNIRVFAYSSATVRVPGLAGYGTVHGTLRRQILSSVKSGTGRSRCWRYRRK